jgi:hypothetical protein
MNEKVSDKLKKVKKREVFADFFKSCEIWEMVTSAVWVGERDVLSAEGGT